MTQEELYEQWQRYMHRADLVADMPQVYDYAASKTINRMMATDITIGDIMSLQPQIMLQAGLCYLSELAMDDMGMDRSQNMFENAAADYQMRKSLEDTPAPSAKIGD